MTESPATLLDLGASLLALAGAFFYFASGVALLRLGDVYARLHAPTKAATLGAVLLALAALLRGVAAGSEEWLKELVIVAFLLLTAPVSAQLLARAAGLRQARQTRRDETKGGGPPPR
jgi:monovalent cation/proton antiporter MnhG/PhaG subunit